MASKRKGKKAAPPAPEVPGGFDELRTLLLGKLPTRVERIEQGHRDPDALTQDVADVLPRAIGRREHPDRELSRALMPTVEQAVTTSVKRNPGALIDAIFPIIGPAIRKAVSEAMGGLVDGLNRSLEAVFTPRGIKWRFEAWRSGRSYGEVVLTHSLVYRVEHAYLIHAETGLLLNNIGPLSPVGEDPEVVSGMFTAIQDFVRDSFQGGAGGSLDRARVGDLTLIGEYGPRALLTVVVRGAPPPVLTVRMQEALEQVHADYQYELEHFTGDNTPFEATEPLLEDCLLVQEKPKRKRIVGPLILSAVVVGLIALLAMSIMRGVFLNQRREDYLARLAREPGLVVVSTSKDGGRLYVHGLKDPAAPDPAEHREAAGLTPDDVIERWDPFYAGDQRFIVARARRALLAPSTIELVLDGETLRARGPAPRRWYAAAAKTATFLPGVAAFVGATEGGTALEQRRREAQSSLVFFHRGETRVSLEEEGHLEALTEILHELDRAAGEGNRRMTVNVIGRAQDAREVPQAEELAKQRARRVKEALDAESWTATTIAIQELSGPVADWIQEAEKLGERTVGAWFIVVVE